MRGAAIERGQALGGGSIGSIASMGSAAGGDTVQAAKQGTSKLPLTRKYCTAQCMGIETPQHIQHSHGMRKCIVITHNLSFPPSLNRSHADSILTCCRIDLLTHPPTQSFIDSLTHLLSPSHCRTHPPTRPPPPTLHLRRQETEGGCRRDIEERDWLRGTQAVRPRVEAVGEENHLEAAHGQEGATGASRMAEEEDGWRRL